MVLKNIQYAFLCPLSNISVSYENIQKAYGYMQEIKEKIKTAKIWGNFFFNYRRKSTKIFASGLGHCIYNLLFLPNKI